MSRRKENRVSSMQQTAQKLASSIAINPTTVKQTPEPNSLGQIIHLIICANRAKVNKALDANKGISALIDLYTKLTHDIEREIEKEKRK